MATKSVQALFLQKQLHSGILSWLKSKSYYSCIRDQSLGISENTIVGLKDVQGTLELLYQFLRLKKDLAKMVLRLFDSYHKKMAVSHLIRLSQLVDKIARFNYSKKCTNTSQKLISFLKDANLFPVETSV